ncbi:ABC-type metal ion transporter, periplasmic subunit [Desulfovibrio sp. X2]|uniref:metal ABC transporter solute-binding protein, Zn/Mn family n=1 Tax=Desulfovibrio sp. X2 TaxID=941449 RepID=UPI000358C358|nr:zinc ABC transporter substrate-binding protein [Desulfovibrio sp. X2]EPR43852.1 ABC-type metal ion transporter, periplasmic subunit [Desulfovibrio sp. X2]
MKRDFVMARLLAAVLAACCLCSPAAADSAQAGAESGHPGRLLVAVSIPAQKHIVEKIAGDLVEVLVVIPADSDPHGYEPKGTQLAALARARLLLRLGVPFEDGWAARLAGLDKGLTVVRTAEGTVMLPLPESRSDENGLTDGDATGPNAAAAAAPVEYDPHVWLSPAAVRTMALSTAQALAVADPAHAAAFRAGLEAMLAETAATDAAVRQSLALVPPGTSFLAAHPAFAYFAHDYGLQEIGIERAGREPDPAGLDALSAEAGGANVRLVLVSPAFPRRVAEELAKELGAKVVSIDPLAEDWSANMIRLAAAVAEGAR